MIPNKKFVSRFTWILLAFSFGVGLCFVVAKGGTLAYGEIYDKTEKMVLGNFTVTPPNIPVSFPSAGAVNEVVNLENEEHDSPALQNKVSIGFVGDIIPGVNALPYIFSDITPLTERPDIMIGNFEGAATSNSYFKCKEDSLNCYAFNGDDQFIRLLALASFDVLNVANNHFNDYGQIGQAETILKIREAGIVASGMTDEITYQERNGLKIAIIGASSYYWTTDMNNEELVTKIIAEANQNADIVIVIFHGGGEGAKYSRTPYGVEWYLGENRGDLRSFAHSAIDAGADIVLGSGPHVLRGIENYKGKLIAYSLGNFASADALGTADQRKTSAMIEATLDKDGSFISGTIFPLVIDSSGIPHPDFSYAAISEINNLSQSDFGGQGITLNSFGEFMMLPQ